MSVSEIVELVTLGVTALGLIVTLFASISRGKLKEFVIAKMEEAEKIGGSGKEKLAYVLECVKKEYKLVALVMNVKEFVEKVIDASKKINCKGGK